MLWFSRVAVLAGGLALVGVSGCKTAPKSAPRVTPLPEAQVTNAPPAPPLATVPIVPIPRPPPPPAPVIATNPALSGWISWESWSLANGAPKPRRVSPNGSRSYELQTTNGTIEITVGNRVAYWNGLAYWLGFAPQLIEGQPFVHAMDAQKNLRPLLAPPVGLTSSNRVLVLDPGHGGKEVGTQSVVDGHFEKEFTLDWAQRIAALMAAKGWQVYLTRTNDSVVTLPDRVKLADHYAADLFISLHFNSGDPNPDPCGLETYCLTPTGLPSTIKRVYADDPGTCFPNNAFDDANFQLALRLHRTLLQASGEVDKGVRRARFMYVVRFQRRPAVLIEGGYLSNPQEAQRIADPAYRQKLAEAVAEALTGDYSGGRSSE